jgi:hypothetical protein
MATKVKFLDKLNGAMKKMANKISTYFSLSANTDEINPNILEINTADLLTEQKQTQKTSPTSAYGSNSDSLQGTDRTITPAYNNRLLKEKRFIQNIRKIMVNPNTNKKKNKKPTKP